MSKRILLFVGVNLLIVTTISFLVSIFGIDNYLNANALNLEMLIVFCLVWGMLGSIISLSLSRVIAKKTMDLMIINPNSPGQYHVLMSMIRQLSNEAKIPLPEVGIYESNELNAFATGPSKKRSLIALSSTLVQNMNEKEIRGVVGHEIAHIANGDMVTMTLVQGIVNAFVLFISRVVSFVVGKFVKEELEGIVRTGLTIVLDIILNLLGVIVISYYSRIREYKADLDSAKIAGKENMISALVRLKADYSYLDSDDKEIAAFKISNKEGYLSLFSTHPRLDERIENLRRSEI